MTKEREEWLRNYVRCNAEGKQTIPTEDGLMAARLMAEIASQEGIACALGGGIAMHVYGFQRATTDVDMFASGVLPRESDRRLSFGGESYRVEVGGRDIVVDWIVRDDDQADLYAAAVADARDLTGGLKIVTPEWLVIIKKLADRGKDHLDLLWLLRQPELVDRALVEEHVRAVFGKFAYVLLQDLGSVYLEADLLKAKDERDEGTRS